MKISWKKYWPIIAVCAIVVLVSMVRFSEQYVSVNKVEVTSNLDAVSFDVGNKATGYGLGATTKEGEWYIYVPDSQVGMITVEWKDMSGYITPPPETKELLLGQTVRFHGEYRAIDPFCLNMSASCSNPTFKCGDCCDATLTKIHVACCANYYWYNAVDHDECHYGRFCDYETCGNMCMMVGENLGKDRCDHFRLRDYPESTPHPTNTPYPTYYIPQPTLVQPSINITISEEVKGLLTVIALLLLFYFLTRKKIGGSE